MFKLFSSRPDYSLRQYAKYAAFMLLLDSVRDGSRDMGIRTFMGWAQRWMQPDWAFRYDATAQTIELRDPKSASTPVYSAHLKQITRDNPIGRGFSSLPERDKHKIVEMLSNVDELLGDAMIDEELEGGYRPEMPDNPAAIADFQARIDACTRAVWEQATAEQAPSVPYAEARRLARLALAVRMADLMSVGVLNVGVDSFVDWANNWLSPDWYLWFLSLDPGALTILEELDADGGSRPLWRGPFFAMGEGVPQSALFLQLDQYTASVVRRMAAAVGTDLDMPHDALLDAGGPIDPGRAISPDQIFFPRGSGAASGITMIDSGFATKWCQVQAVKLGLCTFLCNQASVQNRLDIGFINDPQGCARWAAQWLQPHWQLDILRERSSKLLLPDMEVELYPLTEDGRKEQLYFRGAFVDVIEGKFRFMADLETRDFNGLIGRTLEEALALYGRALDTPGRELVGNGLAHLKGPQVYMAHSRHNDEVIANLTYEVWAL